MTIQEQIALVTKLTKQLEAMCKTNVAILDVIGALDGNDYYERGMWRVFHEADSLTDLLHIELDNAKRALQLMEKSS